MTTEVTKPIETPPNWRDLRRHEFAEMMPVAGEKDYEDLTESLDLHGLRNPIVLIKVTKDDREHYEILDGYNRHRGCIDTKVEPRFVEYVGNNPGAYVYDQNVPRRHMTDDEKAMAVVNLLNVCEPLRQEAEERRRAGKGADGSGGRGKKKTSAPGGAKVSRDGRTNAKLAKKAGVSEKKIADAKVVKEEGTPEDAQEVRDKKATLRGKADEVRGRKKPEAPRAEPGEWCNLTLQVRSDWGRGVVEAKVTGGSNYGVPGHAPALEEWKECISPESAAKALTPLLWEFPAECRKKALAFLKKLGQQGGKKPAKNGQKPAAKKAKEAPTEQAKKAKLLNT
jgi:hypothetical protein